MPQLDLTTYSTLAFYSFIGFNFIYIFISIYVLPEMSFIFKYRYQYLKAFNQNQTKKIIKNPVYAYIFSKIFPSQTIIIPILGENIKETLKKNLTEKTI
jgi:hypothetical protein